ncbi:MAG: hypothetical protein VB081_02265 [Christensenella sp.]|uniref:hypothetical protein n=1 Tax=Christensenella sp. TaxID=1935934 RepID=UPI002B1EED3D|nr:hypothetical protein [Christensenella sp.]MEA5002303.1 hypothetical protein [Christensenella sp.]
MLVLKETNIGTVRSQIALKSLFYSSATLSISFYVHQPVTAKFKSSEEKTQYKFEIQKIESSVLRENLRIYQKSADELKAKMAKLDDLISLLDSSSLPANEIEVSKSILFYIFIKNKKVKDLPNLLEGYSLATLERKLKKAIETIALLSSENNI